MAVRRAPSLCLACQARQALIGRRRPILPKRRRLETLAVVPADDDGGLAMTNQKAVSRQGRADEMEYKYKQTAVSLSGNLPAWDLAEQPLDVREAMRSLEELWKTRDQRIPILTSLSNPWPTERHTRVHNEKRPSPAPAPRLPEANAAPIPHLTFRHLLSLAQTDKQTRSLLRAQLLRCHHPLSILRIIATSVTTSRLTRQSLSAIHEPIVRALYRCRENVDDTAVFRTINTLHARYTVYRVPFHQQLLALGLKFAARTRSLSGMEKYLRALRGVGEGKGMTSNVFRATIAKFSIGYRGLGEIRNGRWMRNELLQVLMGFEDCAHLPPEEQYHLGTFLDRSDWGYLHGWIAALARCRHVEQIWTEWEMWKRSPARRRPKELIGVWPKATTKIRGDYWFVEQMTYSGGLKEAWKIVSETNTDIGALKDRIILRLLEGLEHCPPSVWEAQGDAIRRNLLRKCEFDLSTIERALGVAWVPTDLDDEGEGYHVMFEEQEDVLERLGAEDFKLEEDFGYPYESIVPVRERRLHDAVEVEEKDEEGGKTVAVG